MLMRGSAKLLILHVLETKTAHGYEVAKKISGIFKGLYEPSPGIIYPTLQWLEDQGYVGGRRENGKTVYRITEDGRAFLEANKETLRKIIDFARGRIHQEDFPILRSAARLGMTVRVYLPEMTMEERRRIAKMLDETSKRVLRLMAERGTK